MRSDKKAGPPRAGLFLFTGPVTLVELSLGNAVCAADSSPRSWSCDSHPEGAGRMSQTERFEQLPHEFARVGVDPNTISAGLAVREEDVLRSLSALPDGAGPEAFLS